MQTIKKNLPGIAVCLSIAIPSWLLGKLVPVIGGPVFSILLGMIIALLWTPGTVCKPGIGFTSKKILQAAGGAAGLWAEFECGAANRKTVPAYHHLHHHHVAAGGLCDA